MKKYELLERKINGLCRIRALRDIPEIFVRAGDLGGYVESEDNLSHEGDCWVSNNVQIEDNAWITGDARVYGYAQIEGDALVSGYAEVGGNARVGGEARVGNNARIGGDAKIASSSDILCVCGIGSRFDTTTFYKTKTGISVSCGCFAGTLDEFKTQVAKTHGDNKSAREYELACQLAELHILGGV